MNTRNSMRPPAAPSRAPREARERTASEQTETWVSPSLLPEPEKMPGYRYRWIRASTQGNSDASNVSYRIREGWEPVTIEEQPQFELLVKKNADYVVGGASSRGTIEIGGLMLVKMPEERAASRDRTMTGMAQEQMVSVDNNLMRESDPRMPILRPDRKTTDSFGKK